MIRLLLAMALVTAGERPVQCGAAGARRVHLQWSDSVEAVSPGGGFEVRVLPNFSSDERSVENETPVVLGRCKDGIVHRIFTLHRDAELFWGPGDAGVVVVEQRTADWYTLSFFRTIPWQGGSAAQSDPHLDEAVLAAIRRRLPADRKIGFYLPRVISWVGTEIALAIGGTTYPRQDGPGKSYCYGVIVSSETLHISRVLSASELRSSYHARCRVMP